MEQSALQIAFKHSLRSKLKTVSSNPQIGLVVVNFIEYLSQYDDAYFFGSAIWRIPRDKFDETKNDLDFLLNEKNIGADKQCLMTLCECFGVELTGYELVPCDRNTYDRSQHIMVTINNSFRIDLVYVGAVQNFIFKMADIDIGMLLFSLHKDQYDIGGKSTYLKVDNILNAASNMKITMKYFSYHRNPPPQTKMSRIMKLLDKGFTISSDKSNIQLASGMMRIFIRSFFLPIDYVYPDTHKCIINDKFKHKCTCRPRDCNFVETCLNNDVYQFIKQFYFNYVAIYPPDNLLVDKILAYALYMKDYKFAKSVLPNYHADRLLKFNLMYIPILLRMANNFDLTMHFLDFFNKNSHFDKIIQSSCFFSPSQLYKIFILDAVYSGDNEYCEKLSMYDSILHIKHLTYHNFMTNTLSVEAKIKLCISHANSMTDEKCERVVECGDVVSGAIFNRYAKL